MLRNVIVVAMLLICDRVCVEQDMPGDRCARVAGARGAGGWAHWKCDIPLLSYS